MVNYSSLGSNRYLTNPKIWRINVLIFQHPTTFPKIETTPFSILKTANQIASHFWSIWQHHCLFFSLLNVIVWLLIKQSSAFICGSLTLTTSPFPVSFICPTFLLTLIQPFFCHSFSPPNKIGVCGLWTQHIIYLWKILPTLTTSGWSILIKRH